MLTAHILIFYKCNRKISYEKCKSLNYNGDTYASYSNIGFGFFQKSKVSLDSRGTANIKMYTEIQHYSHVVE